MSNDFEIRPHQGIGPVRLGATRDEVHTALGPPRRAGFTHGRDEYLGGLFVHYDADDRVEFVEAGTSPEFRATFHGAALLDLPAPEALAKVREHGALDETDPELGSSYRFLDLQLALWREGDPTPEEEAEDPEGCKFDAVGVGREGYFTRDA